MNKIAKKTFPSSNVSTSKQAVECYDGQMQDVIGDLGLSVDLIQAWESVGTTS